MSNAISFQKVVEYVESLSAEEQDLLFELIHKRRVEERRSEIARNYRETLEAMKAGKAKRGTVADLRADFSNLKVKREAGAKHSDSKIYHFYQH